MNARTILIEGAVDSELSALIERFKPEGVHEMGGGWRVLTCDMAGGRVALLNTGVGVANAAAATALACAALNPAAVISQGTAGAHDISLHTGDVVVGTRILRLGAYRSPAREHGVAPLEWQMLDQSGDTGPVREYASDVRLAKAARTALTERGYGQAGNPRALDGTIGSGDVWNCEFEMIAHLNARYGTACEEMETYSAASVCDRMGVPFLSLRVISNNERIGESYAPEVAAQLQRAVGDIAEALVKGET